MWCAYLVVFLSRLCVGPLSPFLKESFDLSNAQIGGLTSATAVAYMPTLILAGWLADRIGVRRALIIGTLITGVSVGAVALAPSYGVMLLLLGLLGFRLRLHLPDGREGDHAVVPAAGTGDRRGREPVGGQRQRHARRRHHARAGAEPGLAVRVRAGRRSWPSPSAAWP